MTHRMAKSSGAIVRKDQETSQRITDLRIPDGIQEGTCFNDLNFFLAKETTVRRQSPFRGIQKLQHLREVRATLP